MVEGGVVVRTNDGREGGKQRKELCPWGSSPPRGHIPSKFIRKITLRKIGLPTKDI